MSMRASIPAALRPSFERCRRITRERARNFYYGLKLAPEPKRSALFALYAWMRQADDLVDEASDRGQTIDEIRRSVERFRDHTDRSIEGDLSASDSDDFWPALAWTVQAFSLERTSFHDMLEGQFRDVEQLTIETFDDLAAYCYHVASTVGLLCVQIFGSTDERASSLAVDRGIAFQLTNILRDYAEDFDRGRIYLPQSDFHQFGVTPEQLRNWETPTACCALMDAQIERTRSYYERSKPLDQCIEADCQPVLWAMTSIYRALLERIADEPRRIAGERRIRLSTFRKGMIALEAGRRARAKGQRRQGAPA